MMKKRVFDRAVVIVIDSLGIGELPDAGRYGDIGSHTLDNTVRIAGPLKIPNLTKMGLGLIEGVNSIERVARPIASFGRMMEASAGKDTSTGHWELAGVMTQKPFATFPRGFPAEIMERFEKETGYGYLWGRPASGTEIIKRLGEEHIRSGKPIVYTSADSVFQIAAHEGVIPVDELYRICRIARRFLYEYNVARVIARPFTGRPGSFRRTERRKDFSIEPPERTLLDLMKEKGLSVVGIGKIGDIFVHRGLTEEIHTRDNMEGMTRTVEALGRVKEGLIFTNLVDFDMLYGHRNNPRGYARALEAVDRRLPEILKILSQGDVFVITADHGCDPTTPSTDHSREYVPLLVCGPGLRAGVNLGTRKTFADLGATIAHGFNLDRFDRGDSFLEDIAG